MTEAAGPLEAVEGQLAAYNARDYARAEQLYSALLEGEAAGHELAVDALDGAGRERPGAA